MVDIAHTESVEGLFTRYDGRSRIFRLEDCETRNTAIIQGFERI
ncbi:MAG: hypothetical protein SWJ54_20950 [Cyanobacteriota bacterium]|nr:hypothetical protein [Cyanobacteriota bacterium]